MRGKAGTVTVGIIRDKRQQNVPMKLPAHKTREQGSIAVPDVELGDLDVDIDTDELREQLKNLKPQIERQSRMIAMQLEKQRPEIEKAVRDAQQQINRVEIQKELEKAQAEIAKIDVEKIRREALEQFNKTDFKEMQKELQKEMEQLQKQMREQQDSFRFEMISY
jgi:chromosome segregation ATPase